MLNKTIESFYNFIAQNSIIYEDLIESAKKIFNDDDLRNFIKNKLLPIAKENGYNFTAEDLFKYEKSQLSKLSDNDLENVAGGFSLKQVGGFMSLALVLGSTFAPISAKAMEPDGSFVETVHASSQTTDNDEQSQHEFKISKILTDDELKSAKENFLEQMVRAFSLKDIAEARKMLSDDLSKIRKTISQDFGNNTVEYAEYMLLNKIFERAGPEYYSYINTLLKTKDIDKCLSSINNLEHIQKLYTPGSGGARIFSDLFASSPGLFILDSYNFLTKEKGDTTGCYGLGAMAADRLNSKINKRIKELSESGQDQIIESLNKGKFIDATIALEQTLESYKPIPIRTINDCLDAYVNLQGPLGYEAIQNEIRGISKIISKNQSTGELTVNLEPETYKQLKDIIKQIRNLFESSSIDERITTYRGINQGGLLSLLKANGVTISDENCNVETLLNNLDPNISGQSLSLKDNGFISTSKDEKIAYQFAIRDNDTQNDDEVVGAIFEVDLPSGTHAIDINKTLGTQKYQREQEVLLQNGTEFKIKEVKTSKLDYPEYNKGTLLKIKVEIKQSV